MRADVQAKIGVITVMRLSALADVFFQGNSDKIGVAGISAINN